jgi:hypothetical protein
VEDLTPSQLLWALAAASAVLAAFAAFAEHRRIRRRNLDRPGLVPWNAIQVMAFLIAVIAAGLALKA